MDPRGRNDALSGVVRPDGCKPIPARCCARYLVSLGMSALAKALGVPANRVSEIMRGTRDVSADTAIRLGRYFGTDPRFWLNLQTAHDLSRAERANSYRKIVPRRAA